MFRLHLDVQDDSEPSRRIVLEGRIKGINPPPGSAVAGAEFSPKGGHIALSLYDSGQKKGAVAIADRALTTSQGLPAAAQFVGWLDKEQDAARNTRRPCEPQPDRRPRTRIRYFRRPARDDHTWHRHFAFIT